MIIRANEINITGDKNAVTLTRIGDSLSPKPEPIKLYAIANIAPGQGVDFHIHTGESETYYILSGTALYDDNGTKVTVSAGDTTFTPSGEGHGIKNIGDDTLTFVALIVKD